MAILLCRSAGIAGVVNNDVVYSGELFLGAGTAGSNLVYVYLIRNGQLTQGFYSGGIFKRLQFRGRKL